MCMENMQCVVQWCRDGWDCLTKDTKMCTMICGAADCLLRMKIWCVQLKRRLQKTDNSPLHHFPWFPQISLSLLHEIMSVKLKFQKLCAHWVLKMLTERHKLKWQASTLDFLTQCSEESENFLSHVVTGKETWVSHEARKLKQQSMDWRHASSPTKTKFKQTSSTWKVVHNVLGQKRRSACGLCL